MSSNEVPTDYRDQQLMWIAEVIHSHGIAVRVVGTGQCSVPGCDCGPEPVPWAYTIGFAERGHPEVVTFGLPLEHATRAMNWVRGHEVDGEPLRPGSVDMLDGHWVRFDPVPTEWAMSSPYPIDNWFAHYGIGRDWLEPPEVMQLVWADHYGNFPDDTACDPVVRAAQPVGAQLLGDWAAGDFR